MYKQSGSGIIELRVDFLRSMSTNKVALKTKITLLPPLDCIPHIDLELVTREHFHKVTNN